MQSNQHRLRMANIVASSGMNGAINAVICYGARLLHSAMKTRRMQIKLMQMRVHANEEMAVRRWLTTLESIETCNHSIRTVNEPTQRPNSEPTSITFDEIGVKSSNFCCSFQLEMFHRGSQWE